MFRTALVIGSTIFAGCIIVGCKDKTSSNQAVPPAVSTPAGDAAKTAGDAAKDATSNDDQAKIASAFTTIQKDLKDMKIDDAVSDLKTLQGLKDKMSAEDQLKLDTLTTQVNAAHAGTTMPAMPKMP